MEKCLIIFDIDETLYLNSEKRIPESTLMALDKLKEAGHTLGIATGRAPFEIFDGIKALPFDFFVMANGQLVTYQGTTIYENPIAVETIEEIVAFAEEKNVYLGFNAATRSAVTGMSERMEDAFAHYYEVVPEIDATIFKSEPIFQIWFFSDEHDAFAEQFRGKARLIPWLSNGADIVPLECSKATGMRALVEAFHGRLPQKMVFFGDGTNDIELVEMADIGVAMGNAVEALKEKADFIAKRIEDDGIYEACQQLGLFN